MKKKPMTPQAKILIQLIKKYNWCYGAELGVLQGETFFALLDACPDLSLVGVDIWQQQPDKDKFRDVGGRSYYRYDMEDCYQQVVKKAKDYGSRVKIHRMTTFEASKLYPNEYFDYVMIDADHLYNAVKSDIETWWPKVKPGGMLLGDDYKPHFPGVIKAVNETSFGKLSFQEKNFWCITKE